MKIGIVTITNGENYGNRLQNYAVQQVLKGLGCDVETIKNTTCQSVDKSNIFKDKVKEYICSIYLGTDMKNNVNLNNISRYLKFKKFTQNLIKQSKYIISKDNIPKSIVDDYDYFVCGSDQVWNPNFSFNSEIDFLTFAKKGQRIAYAPSFGVSEIQQSKVDDYIKFINEMDSLSVREKAGADIIKNLTGKEAIVLIDPTMMLSKNEWLDIAKMPKWKSKKKYILTYFLGNRDSDSFERISRISKDNNLEIIDLMNINSKNIYCIDPSEFIALINNAELMCTDSFHGVVFSLIMKTPFILFNRKDKEISMNSRLETLLSLFNMENRINEKVSDRDIFNIECSEVDKIIDFERKKAIKYLKRSLSIK